MGSLGWGCSHVLAQLQLLFFSALAFVWLNKQGLYPPELHAINLDVEWFYRKLAPSVVNHFYYAARQLRQGLGSLFTSTVQGTRSLLHKTGLTGHYLAAEWPTGSMVLWIAIILGSYLLFDHII